MKQYTNIDEYIAAAPQQAHDRLRIMRETIHKVAPEAGEKIGYGIPTFTFHGNLVHFAGYESHIGFYPGSAPIAAFADELKPYKTAKGTVQFPLDKPLPLDLVKRMTEYAVKRNLERMKK